MGTRTHTYFFGEGDLVALRAEAERLQLDWKERSRYVDPEVRQAGDARLAILRDIIGLLSEKVD